LKKIEEVIIKDLKESNLYNWMGVKLENINKGSVELSLQIKSTFFNSHQLVHGGILVTMLDTTMGLVARSIGFKKSTTLNLNTYFLKAATNGKIYCKGYVIYKNQSTILIKGKLYNDENILISYATGTFYIK